MIDICKEVCPCKRCTTKQEECELAKAYEKQIPKKPIVTIRNKDTKVGSVTFKKGVKVYQCHECKSLISCDTFCRTCGQAIDRTKTTSDDN